MSDTTRCVERVELLSLDMDAVEICGVASMGYGVTVAVTVNPRPQREGKDPLQKEARIAKRPGYAQSN